MSDSPQKDLEFEAKIKVNIPTTTDGAYIFVKHVNTLELQQSTCTKRSTVYTLSNNLAMYAIVCSPTKYSYIFSYLLVQQNSQSEETQRLQTDQVITEEKEVQNPPTKTVLGS